MELSYSEEQNRFREEVRAWIAEAMPPHIKTKAENGQNFEHSENGGWHVLYAKGWVAPDWPEDVGGRVGT